MLPSLWNAFPFGVFMAFAYTYHFDPFGAIRQWMNTRRIR